MLTEPWQVEDTQKIILQQCVGRIEREIWWPGVWALSSGSTEIMLISGVPCLKLSSGFPPPIGSSSKRFRVKALSLLFPSYLSLQVRYLWALAPWTLLQLLSCQGHPTFQPACLLFPLLGTFLQAGGPGNPCSSFRLQIWPAHGNCSWSSCYTLPGQPTVLLGTFVIMSIFVTIFLPSATLKGQGHSGLTHHSPGSKT